MKADIWGMPYQPANIPVPINNPENNGTENVAAQPKRNKTLLLITLFFGVIVAAVLILLTITLFSAPETSSPTLQEPKIEQNLVPKIDNFNATQNPESPLEYTVSFATPNFETAYTLEYKIENNKTRVLYEGTVSKGEEVSVPVTVGQNDTSLRLIVRLNNGIETSSWVTQKTLTIKSTTQNNVSSVNPLFYNTPWALEETNTADALNEAVEVGFNAKKYDQENPPAECYSAGETTIQTGEIVAPNPETLDGYNLYYLTQQATTNSYILVYAWCA